MSERKKSFFGKRCVYFQDCDYKRFLYEPAKMERLQKEKGEENFDLVADVASKMTPLRHKLLSFLLLSILSHHLLVTRPSCVMTTKAKVINSSAPLSPTSSHIYRPLLHRHI